MVVTLCKLNDYEITSFTAGSRRLEMEVVFYLTVRIQSANVVVSVNGRSHRRPPAPLQSFVGPAICENGQFGVLQYLIGPRDKCLRHLWRLVHEEAIITFKCAIGELTIGVSRLHAFQLGLRPC